MLESTMLSVILFVVTCMMFLLALDNKIKLGHTKLLGCVLVSIVLGVAFQLMSGVAQTIEIIKIPKSEYTDYPKQVESLVPIILSLLIVTIGADVYSILLERKAYHNNTSNTDKEKEK